MSISANRSDVSRTGGRANRLSGYRCTGTAVQADCRVRHDEFVICGDRTIGRLLRNDAMRCGRLVWLARLIRPITLFQLQRHRVGRQSESVADPGFDRSRQRRTDNRWATTTTRQRQRQRPRQRQRQRQRRDRLLPSRPVSRASLTAASDSCRPVYVCLWFVFVWCFRVRKKKRKRKRNGNGKGKGKGKGREK